MFLCDFQRMTFYGECQTVWIYVIVFMKLSWWRVCECVSVECVSSLSLFFSYTVACLLFYFVSNIILFPFSLFFSNMCVLIAKPVNSWLKKRFPFMTQSQHAATIWTVCSLVPCFCLLLFDSLNAWPTLRSLVLALFSRHWRFEFEKC